MSDSTIFPDSKRCTKCGEIKPLEVFSRNRNRSDGHNSVCKACHTIYRKANYAKNAEKARAYSNNYYAENLESVKEYRRENAGRIKAYQKDYRARTLEQRREYERRWREENLDLYRYRRRCYRQANAEMLSDRFRDYYHADPSAATERRKRWAFQNPDKVRAQRHRRQARLLGNGGTLTDKDLRHIAYIQNGKCCYCGRLGQVLHIDHVIPVTKGGPSDAWNIALCCKPCNSSKGNRTLDQWIKRWYLRQK